MRVHLGSLDAQLAALEHRIEEIARSEPRSDPARWPMSVRGIALKTALGLLAEIGDFRRSSTPREPMSFLGLVASEYSSGQERHRGHITKSGNRLRAACSSKRPGTTSRPNLSKRQRELAPLLPAEVPAPAWRAQVRLHHRHGVPGRQEKRSTVANVAVARELSGFIGATMTHQPLREEGSSA
jgi:transposase